MIKNNDTANAFVEFVAQVNHALTQNWSLSAKCAAISMHIRSS